MHQIYMLRNTFNAIRIKIVLNNMGKITTPFFEVGVLRAMVFYPASGTMRRKVVVPASQSVNPSLTIVSQQTGSQWNPTQASMDRVFYFDVEASAEGAVLSGRWVPLETIGEYSMSLAPETIAFQKILDSIRRGGLPIRDSPKWNQFWSTTADGWMFGGNSPEGGGGTSTIEADGSSGGNTAIGEGQTEYTGGGTSNVMPISTAGTLGRLEGEGGAFDALVAPQPNYGEFDEDMGFVEG